MSEIPCEICEDEGDRPSRIICDPCADHARKDAKNCIAHASKLNEENTRLLADLMGVTSERDIWRRRLHGADNLLAEIDVALGGLPLGVDRVENARRVRAERDALREAMRATSCLCCEKHRTLYYPKHGCQQCRAEKAEAEVARLRALVEPA